MRNLPQNFEHIVAVITETRDLGKLTQYEFTGSLEAHKQRVSKYNTQPLEQVLQAKANIPKKNFQQGRGGSSRGQSPNRGRGRNFPNGGRGRGRKDFSSQQKSGNSDSECFVCQKPGHESKNCWWKCTRCKVPNHSDRDCWYKKNQESGEKQQAANFTVEDEENKLFISVMDVEKTSPTWYLDSGCSNHLTGNQSEFQKLESYASYVELGDGKQVKIEGKGAVAVHTNRGKKTHQ